MGIEKLAQFHKDPAKQRFDGQAVRDARFRRALCSEAGRRWKAYRTQYCYRRRMLGIISRALGRGTPAAGSVMEKTQRAMQARTGPARARLVLTWTAAKRAVAAMITLLT